MDPTIWYQTPLMIPCNCNTNNRKVKARIDNRKITYFKLIRYYFSYSINI